MTGSKTTQVKLLNRTNTKEERGKCMQMSNPGKKAGLDNKRRKAGCFFVRDLKKVISGEKEHELMQQHEPGLGTTNT
jgi:hypothetical protein